MGAYKDKNGKWYISVRYKNWLGEGCRKTKRGFTTKRDALEWEREFLAKNTGSLDMTFGSFYEVYKNNLQDRIRQNTWVTKSSIILRKRSCLISEVNGCVISSPSIYYIGRMKCWQFVTRMTCHILRYTSRRSTTNSVPFSIMQCGFMACTTILLP